MRVFKKSKYVQKNILQIITLICNRRWYIFKSGDATLESRLLNRASRKSSELSCTDPQKFRVKLQNPQKFRNQLLRLAKVQT